MVVLIVVVVVVLALAVGGIVVAIRSKGDSEAAGVGPNEFLQAPPSSFPTMTPATRELVGPGTGDDHDIVIDLVEIEAEVALVAGTNDAETSPTRVLEPEPDPADHVLEALINRARFKQVGVEEVATELVEQADERGEDVSDLLAELVGRTDDAPLDPAPTSELTLFNDAVPSRPGQLTDLAQLAPADKKRLIIRVLCLLVARSEDQQLPPRSTSGSTEPPTSWPLARAAWPVAGGIEGATEAHLPSRRLAKSG